MAKLSRKYSLNDKIYFCEEVLTHTRDGREMSVVTLSSREAMMKTFEPRFDSLLFPEKKIRRPRKFDPKVKKYVFITARVHPGETPGSHVFNGLLKYLLNTSDSRSKILLDNFVFVLIPMLNPDGVYRGHYRTDTQGNNLNRLYINPNFKN